MSGACNAAKTLSELVQHKQTIGLYSPRTTGKDLLFLMVLYVVLVTGVRGGVPTDYPGNWIRRWVQSLLCIHDMNQLFYGFIVWP